MRLSLSWYPAGIVRFTGSSISTCTYTPTSNCTYIPNSTYSYSYSIPNACVVGSKIAHDDGVSALDCDARYCAYML